MHTNELVDEAIAWTNSNPRDAHRRRFIGRRRLDEPDRVVIAGFPSILSRAPGKLLPVDAHRRHNRHEFVGRVARTAVQSSET